MLTYTEVFNRCGDYPAFMTVQDLCSKDVDDAEAEYVAAYNCYKKAKATYDADQSKDNLSKKNWAEVVSLRAQLEYMEKFALYYDFLRS